MGTTTSGCMRSGIAGPPSCRDTPRRRGIHRKRQVKDPAKALPRTQGGSGNPYTNPNARAAPQPWSVILCPRCKARPGVLCTGGTVNGVAVKSPIPHPERTRAVRRAWSTQNKPNT